MRNRLDRDSRGHGDTIEVAEPIQDVFEQPETSLLGEAFGRPLGIGAVAILLLAIVAAVLNNFVLGWNRMYDFSLVAFFVAGGLLLSLLLRSGEPRPVARKRPRARRETEPLKELVFDEAPGARRSAGRERRRGLAEASPVNAPVPAGAAAEPFLVEPEQDDEVAGYQRALLHYVEQGDLHGQGEILRRLGHLAKSRGHLKESQEFYLNSRNSFRQIGDHYAEAAVLLDLGQVLESLGDHDAAGAAYRDANRALLDVAMDTTNRDNSIQAHAAD